MTQSKHSVSSMTGHGEGRAEQDGWRCTVSIRSVNHRHLDVRYSGPAALGHAEPEVRAWTKAAVQRGRVEVRSHIERGQTAAVEVNKDAVWALAQRLEAIRAAAGIGEAVGLSHLIQAGVLREEREVSAAPEDVDALHKAAFDEAMAAFTAFRAREGAAVGETFREHIASLRRIVSEVDTLRTNELSAYRERLRSRLDAAMATLEQPAVSSERLEQEVIIVTERSDIAEEVQRATTHLDALDALLDGPGPHGKRADFLLQELNREANTMASKSVSSALTHTVVEAKALIEQLREQAANVE